MFKEQYLNKDQRSFTGVPLSERPALDTAPCFPVCALDAQSTVDFFQQQGLNTATPKHLPELASLLNRVDEVNQEIAVQIKRLFERLQPLLAPVSPDQQGSIGPEPKTEVGKRISQQLQDLTGFNASLGELLSRLEV